MPDWRYGYHPQDLDYLSRKAKAIGDVSAALGVPSLAIGGGIARERTLERYEYPNNPIRQAAQPLKGLLTSSELDPGTGAWVPLTHDTIAGYFARSNTLPRDTLGNPSYFDRLKNPSFFDVGPGNIKIRTAVSMLQNYNRMFPDSDPLDLKQYNQRYDLLVRDLKNPDSDTTVKIAGLVAREGQDFYLKAMTPQRWGALSDDQRAALLTKYYAAGKERVEDDFVKRGGNPNNYTPDFNGDGSDMYLYDPGNGSWSNPARLRDALSPGLRTQNTPERQPNRTAGTAPDAGDGNAGQMLTAQPLAGRSQFSSSTLPPQVVANADYLRANGFAITPRTMYVAHVIGPQRAVDLFRTGATGSPDVPSADAATGQQVRAWVRALRGVAPAAPALGADAGVSGPPPRQGAFAPGNDALAPGPRTQNILDAPPSRMAGAGPDAGDGNDRQMMMAQPLAGGGQSSSSTLPPQVVANADYLRANGFAITPRTMYVAHVIGPQRAVDLFRTGSTGSPDVPSADAATGQQVRAWVRALRGVAPAAPALGADAGVAESPPGQGAAAAANPWPQ